MSYESSLLSDIQTELVLICLIILLSLIIVFTRSPIELKLSIRIKLFNLFYYSNRLEWSIRNRHLN